jgi:tetratricopeptide (TPR) repeat protein
MWLSASRLVLLGLTLTVTVTASAQQRTPATAPRRAGGVVAPSDQRSDDSGARAVADRAIAELVAWKTDAAAKRLDEHREQFGGTSEFQTAKGLLQFNKGKLPEALQLLTEAAAAATDDPAPEYYRGEVLQAQKKQDAARTAWRRARDAAQAIVEVRPKDARAQYYLGAALIRHEKPEPARTALSAAAKHDFNPTMVRFQVGLSRHLSKQWQQAVEAFSWVIERDERFAPAFFYRGLAWSKLDRKDLMLEDFSRFLALAPKAPEADTARALMGAYAG